MKEFNLGKIIGKKIIAIKGYSTGRRRIKPSYILFDDKKTYIELDEQDPYSYHDCHTHARILYIYEDKKFWKILMEMKDANIDIGEW